MLADPRIPGPHELQSEDSERLADMLIAAINLLQVEARALQELAMESAFAVCRKEVLAGADFHSVQAAIHPSVSVLKRATGLLELAAEYRSTLVPLANMIIRDSQDAMEGHSGVVLH